MGRTDQHILGIPSGLFRRPRFGNVGHFATNPNGVDQADDCPSFSAFEGNRTDMERIMDKT
jgi:hypothetical protein